MWRNLFGKPKSSKSAKERKQEDRDFLRALVELKFISDKKAKAVLEKQQYAALKKHYVRITDILFKEGAVTRVQAELAYEKTGRHYRFCPECLQKHSLKSVREGKHVTCARCHNIFEVTDNVLKVDEKTLKKADRLVIRPEVPPTGNGQPRDPDVHP